MVNCKLPTICIYFHDCHSLASHQSASTCRSGTGSARVLHNTASWRICWWTHPWPGYNLHQLYLVHPEIFAPTGPRLHYKRACVVSHKLTAADAFSKNSQTQRRPAPRKFHCVGQWMQVTQCHGRRVVHANSNLERECVCIFFVYCE